MRVGRWDGGTVTKARSGPESWPKEIVGFECSPGRAPAAGSITVRVKRHASYVIRLRRSGHPGTHGASPGESHPAAPG